MPMHQAAQSTNSDRFDPAALCARLAKFPTAMRALATVTSAEDARWKPAPEHWSILEVCCHMRDEEHEDFATRIASTLRDPSLAWPRLELEGIAERRSYNSQDLGATLDDFAEKRAANIAWLQQQLATADFTKCYVHPKFGALHAGMLLASWAAHDALHARQISKRLYELAARDAGSYSVRYAGEW